MAEKEELRCKIRRKPLAGFPLEMTSIETHQVMKRGVRLKLSIAFFAFSICALVILSIPDNVSSAGSSGHSTPRSILRCDAEAYVTDRDPNGLNVRSAPDKSASIVGNLPNSKVEGIRVHLTGSSGEWVRIDHALEQGSDNDRDFIRTEGWVFAPLLGVGGMSVIKGGSPLYLSHSSSSTILTIVPADGSMSVHGCYGNWLYVQYKQIKGWGAPRTLCANPLTTCV